MMIPIHPQPCPTCGRCPTCGQYKTVTLPYSPLPQQPTWTMPQPNWVRPNTGDAPKYSTLTGGGSYPSTDRSL